MRIIIDADACPDIEHIKNIAQKYNIECHIFSDTSHQISIEYANIHSIEKGFQTVDMSIVNFIKENDIVITQDYGLAALVLTKCNAIDTKGKIYTNNNIDFMLNSRHQNLKLRKNNIKIKGPRKRTSSDSKKLINSIENIIINFTKNT